MESTWHVIALHVVVFLLQAAANHSGEVVSDGVLGFCASGVDLAVKLVQLRDSPTFVKTSLADVRLREIKCTT